MEQDTSLLQFQSFSVTVLSLKFLSPSRSSWTASSYDIQSWICKHGFWVRERSHAEKGLAQEHVQVNMGGEKSEGSIPRKQWEMCVCKQGLWVRERSHNEKRVLAQEHVWVFFCVCVRVSFSQEGQNKQHFSLKWNAQGNFRESFLRNTS